MAYAASANTSANSTFTCPICLDIFNDPIEISCGHSFCKDCIISSLSKLPASQCPVCRKRFTTGQMIDNRLLTRMMDNSSEMCPNCSKMVVVSSLKNHRKYCTSLLLPISKQAPKPRPVQTGSRSGSSSVNRSTFKCPYCNMPNLGREGLIEHVNSCHGNDHNQVVCPICASMPWGNAKQRSTDFKRHLNIRHKFNYDTFVDFNEDEDAILQSVLALSKQDM